MTIEAAIRNTSEIYRPEGARVIDISPGSEPRAEWKPVSAEVPALPREQFPLDVFPEWLRDACGGLSASVQLPADVPACLALGFIGAALNKRVVTVARDGFSEACNLYVVGLQPSGSRKSACFSPMFAPVEKYREEVRAQRRAIAEAAEAQLSIAEAVLKDCEKEAKKSAETGEDTAQLATRIRDTKQRIAQLKSDLHLPDVYTEDATPEALAVLCSHNGGTMLVASSEGNPLRNLANKWRDGSTEPEAIYLKGHAGEAFHQSRLSREGIDIPSLTLSLVCLSQDVVVQRLAGTSSDMRECGMLARLLISMPEPTVGFRKAQGGAHPAGALARYEDRMLRLFRFPGATLRLSAEALDVLDRFIEWLEPRLRPGTGDLREIADFCSKLGGALLRFSGILHCADHVEGLDAIPLEVPASTMERAVRLARYFLAHYRLAAGLWGAGTPESDAGRILDWIIRQKRPAFFLSELGEAFKNTIPDAEKRNAALLRLTESGHLRKCMDTGGRGRPAVRFEVNPRLLRDAEQGA